MAREYSRNWFSMFTDEDFCNQPVFDKWLYAVLLGQPAMNYAGVQPINFRRWRKAMRDGETAPTDRALEQALVRLERRRYVFTDEETGEVLTRSLMRVDELRKQPNIFKSALRSLTHIESPKLAAVMLVELDRIEQPVVSAATPRGTKLAAELNVLRVAAVEHLKDTSDGVSEPFREPFAGDFPEGLAEPFAEGFPRPGEMEPFAEPFREGFAKPPGQGQGQGGISRSADGCVGDARGDVESEPARTGEPDRESDPTPESLEPPTACDRHRHMPPGQAPPCRSCANHREAHERWVERDRRRRASAASEAARSRGEVRAAATAACPLCDETGYVAGRLCGHDPGAADRAARGMARVREALGRRDPEGAPSSSVSDRTPPPEGGGNPEPAPEPRNGTQGANPMGPRDRPARAETHEQASPRRGVPPNPQNGTQGRNAPQGAIA